MRSKHILRITAVCLGVLVAVTVTGVGISAHTYQPQYDIELVDIQPLVTVVPVSQAVLPPPIGRLYTAPSPRD